MERVRILPDRNPTQRYSGYPNNCRALHRESIEREMGLGCVDFNDLELYILVNSIDVKEYKVLYVYKENIRVAI